MRFCHRFLIAESRQTFYYQHFNPFSHEEVIYSSHAPPHVFVGGVKCDAQNLTVTQTPEAGHTYVFQNGANTKFYLGQKLDVTATQYWGLLCTDESNLTRNMCWTLEAGATDGTYRLKNAATGCYLYGYPGYVNGYAGKPYNVSAVPFDYTIKSKDNNRVAIMGSSTADGSVHLPNSGDNNTNTNNKGLVCWGESAPASQWSMKEVSLDDIAALSETEALTAQAVNFCAHPLASVPSEALITAKTNFQNTPSESTLEALKQAIEQNRYVRIVSKSTSDQLSVQADGANVRHYSASSSDASQVWEMRYKGNGTSGFVFNLYNPNAGKYMGNTKAGNTNTAPTADETAASPITFEKNTDSNGGFYVRSNGNKMCCEVSGSDGKINHWNTNNDLAVLWTINQATSIEVALNQVGDHTYATSYLPFAVQSVSGATAYTGVLNAERTTVNMTSVDSYAADEGVVLVGESGQTTATLTFGGSAVKNAGNVFTGTRLAKTVTDDDRTNLRVLGVKDGAAGEIGFFKPNASLTTIGANRAYIDASGLNTTSLLSVNFGNVSGISDALTGNAPAAIDWSKPLYDLSGRRVANPTKGGIYIQAGRKLIVK